MKRLDGCGMVRNFFAPETEFGERPDFVDALIRAYDKAATRASRSARAAIAGGGANGMNAARWDEAVAATLERVLCMLPHNGDEGAGDGDKELAPPERPGFGT